MTDDSHTQVFLHTEVRNTDPEQSLHFPADKANPGTSSDVPEVTQLVREKVNKWKSLANRGNDVE